MLCRGAPTDLHPGAAARDQEARPVPAGRPRPGLLDLEPGQAGRPRSSPATRTSRQEEPHPVNLRPHPGPAVDDSWWRWLVPRRRRRATYTRPHGGCATCWPPYDLSRDRLYGRIKPRKRRGRSWSSCGVCAPCTRQACGLGSCWTTSPASAHQGRRSSGDWAAANNVELAYTPTNASWPNRIEAQFQALRYFTLDGTDSSGHAEQATMIRRYIAWRNRMPTTTGSARSSTGQGCLMRH
jgi:hypothetical protein